jgi:hypothetical protein
VDKVREFLDQHRSHEFFNTWELPDNEIQRRFDKIPDVIKPLAYLLIFLSANLKSKGRNCLHTRSMLYIAFRDIREGEPTWHGKAREQLLEAFSYLPMYWSSDGVMIEPEKIVRLTNGLVQWTGDESCARCMLGKIGGCRFFEA